LCRTERLRQVAGSTAGRAPSLEVASGGRGSLADAVAGADDVQRNHDRDDIVARTTS